MPALTDSNSLEAGPGEEGLKGPGIQLFKFKLSQQCGAGGNVELTPGRSGRFRGFRTCETVRVTLKDGSVVGVQTALQIYIRIRKCRCGSFSFAFERLSSFMMPPG